METLEILSTAKARVDKAVARAEAARYPQGAYPRSRDDPAAIDWGTVALPAGRMGAELNQTFHALMSGDPDIVFFGEDVRSPYGGAFKVSAGLSEVYPTRVHNAPISEACIVGLGTGLAMKGFRPFVEIMFGDFLGLAFDQLLNHASKFEDMYDGQVTVDLVVRTPMGGGRAYGPTHSQTLDRHFVGMPGLTVIALNHLVHPDSVYRPLIAKSHGPTVVMENKVLYGSDLEHTPPTGFETLHSNETFPTGRLRPRSRHVDVTLLGYGGVSSLLVRAAEQLFIEHDVVAQVVCPSRIYPFEVTGILPVLSEADHLVIVEEGQGFAGFGAEVLAQLAEQGRDTFASVQRIHPPASCIPASGPAEMQMLPSVEDVVVRCRGLGR